MTASKNIFKAPVIILLSKETDPSSNRLEIQDFVERGKPFIPVFTSKEKLVQSTQGASLPFPSYSINGLFLIGMMTGNEILRVNPNLVDEVSFIASDLKAHFKKEIEATINKLKSKVKNKSK